MSKLIHMFKKLIQATNRSEIKEILRILTKENKGKWRLVGDRINYPTVHMASSPISAAIERITNAIDAQLESVALFSPEIVEDCKSPRDLVEKKYRIEGGYLTSLKPTGPKRKQLVEESGVSITLRDGNTQGTPTIDVTDNGIGVAKKEFPKTLLSLNERNKINKWYLMGRFGQGGSTTLRFSEYTVMISRRRHPNSGLDKQISFTIIKYREAKEGEKDGQYVYLVNQTDKLPYSIPAKGMGFDGGTLVRHINYEVGKKYFLDVYGHLETYLFDPVLPFWLREERSWETNRGQGRRIFGSRDRLNRTGIVEEKDEFVASLNHGKLGSIVIRYWVFNRGTQTKEKQTFVDPGNPIVVTYLGQTHAKLPRRILATDCRLPNLYKDLVVQIECDNLSDKGRRIVFTSTREIITDEGRRLLKDSLINTLPDELFDLDQKRQMEFLSEGLTKAKEELRRKLAEMINRIKPGTFKIPSGGSEKGHSRGKRRHKRRQDKPSLETRDFPTYIKIGNKQDPLKFSNAWIGTWIEVQSDAPDDFLTKFDATLELSEETKKFCQVVVKHKDFKGGRVYIKAGLIGDPPVGKTFPFGIILRFPPHNGVNEFCDSTNAIIVEPSTGGKNTKPPLDAPNIWPVNKGDAFWIENEWTDENIAEVREGKSIDIYVSLGNKWLMGTLTGSKYTSNQQEIVKNKYILNMAFYAYLQNKGLNDITRNGTESEPSLSAQNISEELLERIQQDSLEWSARTILTAITSERGFLKTSNEEIEME